MTEITLKKNQNVLLIDTSYYIFYRYFATLRWYSFQMPKDDSGIREVVKYDVLHENEEFLTAMIKHMTQELMTLRKKWKVPIENMLFCTDCPRNEIWRHSIYDGYKGSRTLASNFNGNIFPYFYKTFVEKNYQTIGCSKLEADDVVSIMAKSLSIENKIVIITNDNDYLQLKKDHIEIYNVQGKGKDICTRGKGCANIDLYMKICLGDSSDNISPVYPKLSAVTAEKLAEMTEEERIEQIRNKGGDDAVSRYNLNKRLISFECIPDEYITDFHSKFKILLE